jgi:hypothetical protein
MKYKLQYIPGRGSMLEIKAEGRGSVPQSLRGMYTNKKEAEKAVESYENNKKG